MALRWQAERVVVKCPNWVGDLVAATGALRCLRRNYASAHIALVVKPSLVPLIEDAPWFDDVIPFDRHESTAEERRHARRRLREGRFGLAVLLTHSFSSRRIVRASGVPVRVGFVKRWPGLLLTDALSIRQIRGGRPFVSKVEIYCRLCERLGCEGADDQRPELFVGEDARAKAADLLDQARATPGRRLVGLVPGASYGPSKRWPAERFALLADGLSSGLECDVVLLTSPQERDVADAVAADMQTTPLRIPDDMMDLGLLKALVARCDLIVGNDTGPRHIAAAFGVPAITLMGPTDPRVTESPYENGVVLRQSVPCAPCYERDCPRDHECMTAIDAAQVHDAAARLLAGPQRGSASSVSGDV